MTAPPARIVRRTITLDGRRLTIPLFAGQPLPGHQCGRRGAGLWQHYAHVGGGVYQHRGMCDDADHGEHGHPGERDSEGCCCGRSGCGSTGPWPGTGGSRS